MFLNIFCFIEGGHTTEMMRLLGSLSSYYQPRIYIVAETDKMSVEKITSFEKEKTSRGGSKVGIDKSLILFVSILLTFPYVTWKTQQLVLISLPLKQSLSSEVPYEEINHTPPWSAAF